MLTVFYHADADGFGAAWAIWKNLEAEARDNAVFKSVQYGDAVPAIDERTTDLMIVDFSFSREVCDELAAKYKLVVIDHHETAQAALNGASYAIFDMSKSGAVLTWEYMTDEPMPTILQYVQDYDLWLFELTFSREVNAFIASLDHDFVRWNNFVLTDAVDCGMALLRVRTQQVKAALKQARKGMWCEPDGLLNIVSVNWTTHVSEVGEALLDRYQDADFVVIWRVLSSDETVYSLRSRDGGTNVAEVAAQFEGGGGHACAAGFKSSARLWG